MNDKNMDEIRLDDTFCDIDHVYVHHKLVIVSGKGKGQFATIVKYDGKRKIATIKPAFQEQPDETSRFLTIRF